MIQLLNESNETYHADTSRLSNSMLGQLAASPELFRDYYVTKTRTRPEPNESMAFGSLLHCMVLEPHLVGVQYALKDGIDRRTKEGKAAWAKLCVEAIGKTIVTGDDYNKALTCASRLLSHDQAGKLLTAHLQFGMGIVESRIDFELDGTPMRCKPDLILPSHSVIVDVKTTKSASPGEFANSCADYGYARQAALYMHAAAMHYGSDFRFVFAVVATNEPYEVACYELDDEAIDYGMADAKRLIAEYQRRMESNDWRPDWSSGIVPLSLPKYLLKR